MAAQIGIVKTVVGNASATLPDGSTRQLQVGDKLFANEILTTTAAGAIEIELVDGYVTDLGPNAQINLADVAAIHLYTSETEATPDPQVDALQQAIVDGADPTQITKATAAGTEIRIGGNEGSGIVQVNHLAPQVTPTSGFDTTGIGFNADLLEEVIGAELLTPAPITPGTITASVDEAGLPGVGSSADQNSEVVSGSLNTALFSNFILINGEGENGTLTLNSSGNYTYTLTSPTTDLAGVESNTFTYTAQDPNGNTVTGTIVIEIIDDVPTAVVDTNEVTEGVLLSIDADNGVLTNDIFGADQVQTKTVTGVAAGTGTPVPDNIGSVIVGQYGTLTLAADGSYGYKANPDVTREDVSDIFTYTITDGDGDTSTTTLTINVGDVTLVANNQTNTVREDALDATAGDDDVGTENTMSTAETTGMQQLTVTGATGPISYSLNVSAVGNHGTLTFNADGSYSYTLTDNILDSTDDDGENTVLADDTFEYTAEDANGNTVTGTITINVVDDIPVATNDIANVTEGNSSELKVNAENGVLTNDTLGADGSTVTDVATFDATRPDLQTQGGVSGSIEGEFGFLTLNADGSYTYTTKDDGADSITEDKQDVFIYTITDGDGDTSTATLTINVDDVTLAPDNQTQTVREDALNSTVGDDDVGTRAGANTENTGIQQLNVIGATEYSLNSSAIGNHGTLTFNANGSYSYTLTDNIINSIGNDSKHTEFDAETFTYTATDANGNTVTGTIVIDVIDDAPLARADSGNVTEGDTLEVSLENGVLSNDSFGADGSAGGGDSVVSGVIAGRGRPDSDPMTNKVGDEITGRYGKLTLNSDGSYTYDANPDSTARNVNDTFTYSITDGDGDIATARLTIRVNNTTLISEDVTDEVKEAGLPEGSAPAETSEIANGSVSVVGANRYNFGTDANGDPITEIVGSYGTLTINNDGSYTYTLTSPFTDEVNDNNTANRVNGVETFTYTALDVNDNTVTGTITINVIDDIPTAVADTNSVTEGAPITVDADNGVLANDNFGADDIAGLPSSNVVSGVAAGLGAPVIGNLGNAIQGTFGTLTLNNDGSYTYDADPDVITGAAKDVFTYSITDADGDVSITTLTIDVSDVTIAAASLSTTLFEAGLADGSAPSVSTTTFTGTLNVTDAETYILNGNHTSNANGDLELIGSNGTLTFNTSTGAYTYVLTATITDNTNQTAGDNNSANVVNGVDSFSYTAVDADGNTAGGSININVIDDVPVANIDIYDGSVDEGTSINVDANNGVLANDTFGADGPQTKAVTGVIAGTGTPTGNIGNLIEGAYGFLQLNADGSYNYTASKLANITGDAKEVFTYIITDNDGDTSSTTLTINVNDVPPAGPGNGSSATVFEAGLSNGSASSGSSETAGGQITENATNYSLNGATGTVIQGLYGTLTLNPNGSYTYTLTSPVNSSDTNNTADVTYGAETFNYTAIDTATGLPITGTININVVDDIPLATADTNTVEEGDVIVVDTREDGVLGNDTYGADGEAPSRIVGVAAGTGTPGTNTVGTVITGAYGTLTLNEDGTYTYDADADAISGTGKDVFTYTIEDGDGDTSTTTLTIDVTDITLAAPSPTITIDEASLPNLPDMPGAAPISGSVSANNIDSYNLIGGTDIGGGELEFEGTYGTLTLNTVTGVYTYTLDTAFTDEVDDNNTANMVNGVESFSYTVVDAFGNTGAGSISINLIDDVPVATADIHAGIVEEGELISVDAANGVLSNDDFGADVIPSGNVVSGVIAGSGTGAPIPGNVGNEIQGAYGKLTLNDDGSYDYQATPNQVTGDGKDIFTYTITDNDGDSSTTTLTINLADTTLLTVDTEAVANEAGIATGDTVTGQFEVIGATGYNLGPSATATADGFELVGNNGTLTVNSTTGEYTYTLTTPVTDGTGNNGRNTVDGVETFTFIATDNNGNSVASTLTIDVVDDVPVARADTNDIAEGGELVITEEFGVLANDVAGADGATVIGVVAGTGNPGTANIGTGIIGQYGTLTLSANGGYTYQANAANTISANVTDTFTYRIQDADGDISTTTLKINVTDGVPTAEADINDASATASLTVDAENGVLSNDDFGSDAPATVTAVGAGTGIPTGNIGTAVEGAYGTLTLNSDGSYDYTKDINATTNTTDARDTFTYSITDADGDISSTTLTFKIADEIIVGDTGNNTLAGGGGNDILSGGQGSDILSGGDGNDLFIWHNGDEGTVAASNNDIVTDFTVGQDSLDLSGILQGENYTLIDGKVTNGNLLNYLDVSQNGNDTVITVKPDGGSDATQVITLQNTLIPLAGSQADIIGSLLADGSLIVDQSQFYYHNTRYIFILYMHTKS